MTMTTSTTTPAHAIIIPLSAWGHIRPLLHLSLNLLTVHPSLHLTILPSPSSVPLVEREFSSGYLAHIHQVNDNVHERLIDRLQIVHVKPTDPTQANGSGKVDVEDPVAKEATDFATNLPIFLKQLFSPTEGGETFEDKFNAITPSFVIYDLFLSFVPPIMTDLVKSLNKPLVPLIGFFPSNAAATWNHFATEEEGGLIAKAEKRVQGEISSGVGEMEAYAKWAFSGVGQVAHTPGLPPMYDWEIYPSVGSAPIPTEIFRQVGAMCKGVRHPSVSAIILPSTAELEMEAQKALEDSLGVEVLMAGPQFPQNVWKGVFGQTSHNKSDQRVIDFLDRMEKKHGRNSVVYVSTGSAWFPVLRPELIYWIVESLIDHDIPFVFGHASFMEQLPAEFLQKLNDREDSIEVKFAPQWNVLEHPATGFFLSHCGSNSTAEAILSEKPVIAFPFAADQGEFTAALVQWGCAVDLKQVKTPKPATFTTLYDGTEIRGTECAVKNELDGVWNSVINGGKGESMRGNMKKIREICETSWKEGESRRVMEGFSKWF